MRIFHTLLILLSPVTLAAQAEDLFISEYIEGSGYNKAVEIYNGTGYAVDLSAYRLEQDNNGDDTFSVVLQLSGYLQNDDVYVVTRPSADQALVSVADTLSGRVTNFNGDDQIRLVCSNVEIDRIGIPGGIQFARDVTFVRKNNIKIPASGEQDPRSNGEWLVYDKDYFADLGRHWYTAGFGDLKPFITRFIYSPLYPEATDNIKVTVEAFDDSSGLQATLFFEVNDHKYMLAMPGSDSLFSTIIPASEFNDGDRLEYFVMVEDMAGQKDSTGKVKIFAGTTAIASIKETDNEGILRFSDYRVRVKGIVTTSTDIFGDNLFLQDETAAIKWQHYMELNGPLYAHLISVQGMLKQVDGMIHLETTDSTFYFDFGQNIAAEPDEMLLEIINNNGETFEAALVKIHNIRRVDNSWPKPDTDGDIWVSDTAGNSLRVYIDHRTAIDNFHLPQSALLNISGILIQSDSSSPYNSGYKIMPRWPEDIDIIAGLDHAASVSEKHFRFYPPYPNPLNSHTSVHFYLPPFLSGYNTELEVYNLAGQKLNTMLNNKLPAGSHSFLVDFSAFASGIYFIVLRNRNLFKVSRLIVIK